MSSESCKDTVSYKIFVYELYKDKYIHDLALNNLQGLMCLKTPLTIQLHDGVA